MDPQAEVRVVVEVVAGSVLTRGTGNPEPRIPTAENEDTGGGVGRKQSVVLSAWLESFGKQSAAMWVVVPTPAENEDKIETGKQSVALAAAAAAEAENEGMVGG